MPAESQWDLLEEYLLNSRFDVAWIDTEKIDEAAERFRVDPGSGVLCDLDTALSNCQILWIAGDLQGSKPLIEGCEVFVCESPV